jgi:RNA polymerase sigma-70 factor, ECF subfamily
LTAVATSPARASVGAEGSASLGQGIAFQRQLAAMLGTAYRLALSLSGHPSMAEGLVEEAAVRACRGAREEKPDAEFKRWFLRVLVDLYACRCADAGPAISSAALDGPTSRIVRAIRELPAEDRVVTALYFTHDLRYEEIAAVLRLPVATVRARLHGGRRSVMRALGHGRKTEGSSS